MMMMTLNTRAVMKKRCKLLTMKIRMDLGEVDLIASISNTQPVMVTTCIVTLLLTQYRIRKE